MRSHGLLVRVVPGCHQRRSPRCEKCIILYQEISCTRSWRQSSAVSWRCACAFQLTNTVPLRSQCSTIVRMCLGFALRLCNLRVKRVNCTAAFCTVCLCMRGGGGDCTQKGWWPCSHRCKRVCFHAHMHGVGWSISCIKTRLHLYTCMRGDAVQG
jgi:hypothetical protein